MKWRSLVSLAAICLLLPMLAACGDDDTAQPPPRAPHVLWFEPEKDARVNTASVPAPALGSDPLDAGSSSLGGSDPLDSGKDAVTRGNAAGGASDPLSGVGTSNWYWLRGSISGGTINVAVNGVTLGQYSVHMDKEITRMLHPGSNSITFTSQRDIAMEPVQAHLEVVYSQMSPDQPPPLIYDTRQMTKPAPALARPPAAVYKPVESDQSESSPAITAPPHLDTNPLQASGQDGPTTLTFAAQ